MTENSTPDIANEFEIYGKLHGIDRWKFRRSLKWIRQGPVCLQLLLDLDRRLAEKPVGQALEILRTALAWYNREVRDRRLVNRVQPSRLPDMLSVVMVFLEVRPKLHPQYRKLVVRIVYAGDNLRKRRRGRAGVTPEQLRIEAAKAVSSLGQGWQHWEDWRPQLDNEAERTLVCLESISHKVGSLQEFTSVRQDMAPAIGWEATASLMAMSQDFHEFSGYFDRVTAQLQRWRWPAYKGVFRQIQTASELDRVLVFLETLAAHPLMVKCLQYTQIHEPANWLGPSREVKDACLKGEWKKTPDYDVIIDCLAEKFLENIVRHELAVLWWGIGARKIRWQFDTFTEYVPYHMKNEDWTVDNDRTRHYWNWQEAHIRERNRFESTLEPRLCSVFRELAPEEFEIVLSLLPNYAEFEEFTAVVMVPVDWSSSSVWGEAYDKWAGSYQEEIPVARPRDSVPHTFTFERITIQKAINLLDDRDDLCEAIQTYRS
jgi:hypothetical protein